MGSLKDKDLQDLAKRLSREPEYRQLDLGALRRPADLDKMERFMPGDQVRVPRSAGNWSLGVLAEVEVADQLVSVVVLSGATGRVSTKQLTIEAMIEANPLRIGDFVVLDKAPFWVAGIDVDGEFLVLGKNGSRVDPSEFRGRLEQAVFGDLDAEVTVQLPKQNVAKAVQRPVSMARPVSKVPYTPIEMIIKADSVYGLIAGNKETNTVYNLRSPLADAALHTDKGENYKAWNEDGGALFADADGRLFLGVFDQAGGEGSDEKARGAASAIAGEMLFEETQQVADECGDRDQAEAALIRAVQRAHEAIIARGKGEVTTFVGAMIDHEEAVIVNVGDSGAMQFSSSGQYLRRTEPQGVGRLLLEGLGMLKKRQVDHVCYRWAVVPGEFLVFGSDGLFDSRLTPDDMGKILVSAGSAAQATRQLRDKVRERMRTRQGKPDNLTVLVVRVGEKIS